MIMRRWLTAVVLMAVCSHSLAQSNIGAILTPTPLTVALTVGKWLTVERKRVYYIEVESRAETFAQAREQGFRLAVEHSVGSLIMSESRAEDRRLVRDEIITYSSGYIDRFEIVSRDEQPGITVLRMKIWVSHSAIATRLLGESATAGGVDGERTATQAQTITQQRQAGDRVLATVLADYPERAFRVTAEPSRTAYDSQRQIQLRVGFLLQWEKAYLDSISEALRAVNHHSRCDTVATRLAPCPAVTQVRVVAPGFSRNTTVGFNDNVAWHLFQQHAVASRPQVQIRLLNRADRELWRQCYSVPELDHLQWSSWNYVTLGPGEVTVRGDAAKRYEVWIPLQGIAIEELSRFEVQITRANKC